MHRSARHRSNTDAGATLIRCEAGVLKGKIERRTRRIFLASNVGCPSQGAVGASSYAITPGGLYSNQQGSSITFISATLTISPLALNGSIAGSSTRIPARPL